MVTIEANRHRAGKCSLFVAIDDEFGEFADCHIAPVGGLQILKGGHGCGGEQRHRQNLIHPEHDLAAWELGKADVSQIAHEGAPQRAIEYVEADGKECQHEGGQAAVEQE